ncbi:class I SAM-dependent methyltransferase [Actinoplanes bogorensis]|uniref:Class I SAM-dependent methyltransferase n=1 Tax=Paractinoplanes bogorensis TaxID=1610840 RepID=A0ABS5YM44_9ACTN|nr:methyltransferase domain-containing protein [Actinoplanes bogorensis]MBU2664524.1 class I SAM-dependent methyltransferase [Actinoplanes bogorensis]
MSTVDDVTSVRYERMRWNTPLSQTHADLLLQRLGISAGAGVVDLGCGWGELLLQAVGAGSTTGIGVDIDDAALARGRKLAADRSLDKRVTFLNQEASAWREPADRVLCIGASHAFGGTATALESLAGLVRPGGRLLFGDGFWERPPSPEATEIIGPGIMPLAGLVEQARELGWRVLHMSVADQREWDDFESTWLAGRQAWLLRHPDDPRATELRDELDIRLREYVGVYRGVFGFAYLILGR